jgi:Protein of unknown function (DUF2865)
MKIDGYMRRCALAILCLTAVPSGAFAQSAICQGLRNQLAALDRAGGGRANAYIAAAQRQINEMQRAAGYARQIGCGNTRFLIFGSDPPAQCAELTARLGRMQANLANLQGQAERLGGAPSLMGRRAQIEAAIQQYCGLETREFDHPPMQEPYGQEEASAQPDSSPDYTNAGEGLIGKPVCVRLCDGYFFPLAGMSKRNSDGAAEMCQAQCPGTETEAFFMGSSDDIAQATGQGGKTYMELTNALRYQKATVPDCSCRRPDQSWGQALKGAEDMLGPSSDVIVSADKAEEMSRPAMPAGPKKPGIAKGAAKGQQPVVIAAPSAAPPATAPPASPADGEGGLRQTVGPDGTRNVRVIAPPLTPRP